MKDDLVKEIEDLLLKHGHDVDSYGYTKYQDGRFGISLYGIIYGANKPVLAPTCH